MDEKEKEFLKNHPIITLGTGTLWDPISIVEEDGKISGYDADVLKLINNLTGANFVLEAHPWEETQKLAQEKKLYGLMTVIESEKREEIYNFSKPHSYAEISIVTNYENKDKFKTLEDLKVASVTIARGHVLHENLVKKFAIKNIFYGDSIDDTIKNVNSKKTDIIFAQSGIKYSLLKNRMPILYDTNLFYQKIDFKIAINKDYPEAISIINKALDKIGNEKLEELRLKWHMESLPKINENKLNLTPKEKEFLKNNTFNIHLNEWRPFRIYNDITKEYFGLAFDYFNLINKDLNLKYNTKHYDTFSKRLENSKTDSNALTLFTAKIGDKEDYSTFTIPYSSYPVALVTNIYKSLVYDFKDLEGKDIAVGRNFSAYKFLKQFYPNINFIFTKNTVEAIDLVAQNRVYGAIDLLPVLQYELNIYGNSVLKIAGISKQKVDICISVSNEKKELIPILNKVIDSLPKEEKELIDNKWFANIKEIDSSSFLELTNEEKNYLKNKESINICARHNHYPVSGVKDGKLVGIAGDVFSDIEKRLNTNFKVIDFKSNEEMLEAIKTNRCDLISVIRKDFDKFKNIKTSKEIFKTKFAVLGNIESLVFDDPLTIKGHTFYTKDIIQKNLLEKKYPNFNVILEENLDTIMNKVFDDKYSHYVNNFINIDYVIQKYGADKYKFNGLFQELDALGSIGVDVNKNPLLLDIINKTLAKIGETKLESIVNEYKLKEFVIKKDYNIYFIYALILLFILISLLLLRSKEIEKRNKLIENERDKFRQIIDNSSDFIHIINTKGCLADLSDAFAKSLGYSKNEMVGMNVKQWDCGLTTYEENHLDNSFTKTRLFTTKHKRKDGTIFDVQVSSSPINIDGEIYLYASSRDITDSIELQKIKELTNSLEEAQKISKLGSWKHIIKTDEYIASKEYYNIFEIEDDTNYKTLASLIPFVHKDDLDGLKNIIKRSHEKNDINKYQYRIITNSKKVKYLEINWNNSFDKNGVILFSEGTIQDITEKVKKDEELESQKAILLHQNRLAQLGEMVSMIAHQWRQPLGSLSIWKINLINEVNKDKQNKEKIEFISLKINQIIEHMNNTIEDFKNFYKPDKQKEEFDLNDSINSALNIIEPIFNSDTIYLEKELKEGLVINSYKNELKQVLVAILNNSKDAFENNIGEKRIKISTKLLEDGKILLQIDDNAGGIKKEIQNKIFEPYFSTKKDLNGTGLGLYMAKMLVSHMNGTINFESKNKCTTFKIVLPPHI